MREANGAAESKDPYETRECDWDGGKDRSLSLAVSIHPRPVAEDGHLLGVANTNC
jgi:hypothetical protein